MNKRAIEVFGQVIRVVEGVKDSEFNIDFWRCGAVGCVLGHCSLDSWFNKEGFYWCEVGQRPAFRGFEDFGIEYTLSLLLGYKGGDLHFLINHLFFKSGYDPLVGCSREIVLKRLNDVLTVLKGGEALFPSWVLGTLIKLRDCNDENSK